MVSIPQMVYQGMPTLTTNATPTLGAINVYDASGGSLAVALPALSSVNPGVSCILQKSPTDLTSNPITFTPDGTDFFDNGATAVFLTQPGEIKVLQKISVAGANAWMITNTVAQQVPYWETQPAGQITTLPRVVFNSGLQLTSGAITLAYFQTPAAATNLAVSNVVFQTGSAAAAGLTLAKVGLFSIDGSGNLTRIGATASAATVTALQGATNTASSIALTAPVTLSAGTVYATGILATGTTMPMMSGLFTGSEANLTPRLVAAKSGLTDLPTTINVGDLVNEFRMLYFRMH